MKAILKPLPKFGIKSSLYKKEISKNKSLQLFLKNKKAVPIYYQKVQPNYHDTYYNIDANYKIGYVNKFYIEGSDLCADVTLDVMHPLAHHFQGVIDNYSIIEVRPYHYAVARCMVYDKNTKRKVNEMRNMNGMQPEEDKTEEPMSVCIEVAGAESIPELHIEAPKAE